MLSLLVFILSVSGLSWIVVRGKICKPLREKVSQKKAIYEICVKSTEMKSCVNSFKLKVFTFFENILNCHGCFGFWAGLICYTLQKCNCEILLFAFIGSIASLLLIGLFNFLDKK